ncbi:hypothetical protein [Actinomarinicola tropica]|uniref:Uncharacterized protein n=1 Tax=Actinomarinicola tropica TaxID=2789776 RepID=A0A5Q2RIZ5_9ACTN|nr:hypothetical protein [Actinomarinicola tropica]QGG93977.1 hypothetical protein GH723_02005 [Actinomarinicola tropica]
MSGAGFLLIALVVGVLGTMFVMARHRQGTRPDDAMAEFRREMQALAPPGDGPPPDEPRRFPHRPYPGVAPLGPDDRSRPDAGSGAR